MINPIDLICANIELYISEADRDELESLSDFLAKRAARINEIIEYRHGEIDEVVESDDTLTREQRAQALLRDMYMEGRKAYEVGVDKHNPYAWGEANPVLMKRLKEFL